MNSVWISKHIAQYKKTAHFPLIALTQLHHVMITSSCYLFFILTVASGVHWKIVQFIQLLLRYGYALHVI